MSESAVVEEYSVSDNDMTAVSVKPVDFSVTLPDKEDYQAIIDYVTFLSNHKDTHGVKTLTKWLTKYVLHASLTETMWSRVTTSANVINGIRNATQQKGDKKRSLRSTAELFYSSLSTPVLRAQCRAFDLHYEEYDSIESVVAALVDKSVETIG